jgi:hypothetical protein
VGCGGGYQGRGLWHPKGRTADPVWSMGKPPEDGAGPILDTDRREDAGQDSHSHADRLLAQTPRPCG